MGTPVLAAVPASELAYLTAFYTQTNGAGWTTSTNWNTGDPCDNSWFGIICNAGKTSVTDIYIVGTGSVGNNLVGTLPTNLNAALPNLKQFYVINNPLLIGPIPSLAGLSSLQTFSVTGDQLTGSIPSLTGLSSLDSLNVSNNQLTGPIPSLAGLANLRVFLAVNNQLTGSIPSLTDLSGLTTFNVRKNQLTGSIPSLAGLSLTTFLVDTNQLTGTVPDMPVSVTSALLCPNYLTPASTPPSAIDLAWNTSTHSTPWSAKCTAAPVATPVPTLSQWGLLLLSLLLAASVVVVRRRG